MQLRLGLFDAAEVASLLADDLQADGQASEFVERARLLAQKLRALANAEGVGRATQGDPAPGDASAGQLIGALVRKATPW
ncbi:MAG: hypothetical protein AAFQ35_06780 [Pseudomonadota bacterium]